MAEYTSTETTDADGTVKSRYNQLATDNRTQFLYRARECAVLTIPTLVPPEGASQSTRYSTPYQSLGARGVNNLAAKLLLTLLPPNAPFFRFYISEILLEKISGQEGMRAEIEEAFDRMERAVMGEIETGNTRTSFFELLKQLLVAGNVLVYMLPQGGVKIFRLDRFVVKRDPSGNVMEHITHETISEMELPESIRASVMAQHKADGKNVQDNIDVYTRVLREEDKWTVRQEVCGMTIPGSGGSYPLGKSPWMALRFITVDGEDYGRSYVEEYLGDLKSLEGLMKSIVQFAAAASKILFLVKPNASTKHSVLTKAESGAVREGNKDDVTVLQMEKFADFKVALETVQKLEQRLEMAFLLNSAIQRNGDRVTAEEIRFMAQELETALGGIYSILSQDLQLPFITRTMFQMERKGKLPVLPEGLVKPAIITGVEALGRGNDVQRLKELLLDIQPFGPEVLTMHLNVSDFIKRMGAARGIDMKGLIPSEAQIAERQQQQAQAQMMDRLGPNVTTQLGSALREQASRQSEQQQPQQQ
jgi:hypothetical protein